MSEGYHFLLGLASMLDTCLTYQARVANSADVAHRFPVCPSRKVASKMAGNKEVTSAKAASAAAKVLSNPKSSAAAKTAAASALTQRPNRKK
jgi:hypothetical protein